MPRMRLAPGAPPSWDALYQLAAPQAGYFSVSQAAAAGYSIPLIQYYVRRGRLQRALRGILRLAHFPPGEFEDLVPIWLWSRREGLFSHETALVLHGLSDALPGTTSLTLPEAWRRRRIRVPTGVVAHYDDVRPADSHGWARFP